MIISKEIRELAKAMGIETEGNGTSDAIRDLTKAVKEGRVQLGGGAPSWDDIANKPFELIKTIEYDVLHDNVTVSENGTFSEPGKLNGATVIDEVNNFVVIFDEVEYNFEITPTGHNYKFGNLSLADSSKENTGEPFCLESYFYFNVDDMSQDEADKIYLAEQGVSHTLSIKKANIVLTKTAEEEYEGVFVGREYPDSIGGEVFNAIYDNVANGEYSHAEGYNTIASGKFSHAEGYYRTTASGEASHAEGYLTKATGKYSHAEGNSTHAEGNDSHAEGNTTMAIGHHSHAEGIGTRAHGIEQHVQGKFNIEDIDDEGNPLNTYAHIVGNGFNHYSRSNIHTLDWDGNAWFAGGIELNSPDGTRYRITVADGGTLTVTAVTV